MDWTTIAVSAIGGGSAVLAAGLPVWLSMKKTERKVDAVHSEVRTNHGKQASEYLEMIAEVKTAVELVGAGQAAVVQLIAEHTTQDAVNFESLRGDLRALEAKVSAAA